MYYGELGISVAERTRRREEEILAIIKLYWKKYNYSPTIREISKRASVTSTSTVLKYLNKLQEKGIIDWQEKAPRAIRIIDQPA
ncbi:transcriptional regulator [Neobacillus sp. MM2021_6]|uniref:LexA family protein n=1 Tax=Bacillaceae TaxID=186817 RepID=UPI00140BE962|nr:MULTISPECIES: transcriptional regulator [Bacillaceae]MBO0962456.1 transcriptional regulator [Neobacillus sp. MM2021_6]